jgi:hypothetical protein
MFIHYSFLYLVRYSIMGKGMLDYECIDSRKGNSVQTVACNLLTFITRRSAVQVCSPVL